MSKVKKLSQKEKDRQAHRDFVESGDMATAKGIEQGSLAMFKVLGIAFLLSAIGYLVFYKCGIV